MPEHKHSDTKLRATILCLRSRQVLLVRKRGGKWNFPGGAIEANETPRQAAARELREETSLCLPGLLPLCAITAGSTLHHVFTTQFDEGAEPVPQNEIAGCKWVGLGALGRTPLTAAAMALLSMQIPALMDVF
ncbi:NUDIX domain-containing protein [Pseudomonas cremoricolorata]|uniref:NUDIX hydrolase n=1 Tax=Pseudomonas cremoricolorata TaxID=157783 RepID=A0A089WWV0_9PSED|nr:NUDIX domain-containing protein [Pseudomonas cremoricolorata]AIR91092.1 NUDIX hydrolase [Pseudomonas cremoricolorata]